MKHTNKINNGVHMSSEGEKIIRFTQRAHKTGYANNVSAHDFCYIYLVKEGDTLTNNPQGNTIVLMMENSLKTPNGCIIFCECKSD